MATVQRDRLVIEPDNPAATLLMVAIEETDDVTDRHLIAAEPLGWLFADLDVGTLAIVSEKFMVWWPLKLACNGWIDFERSNLTGDAAIT